MAIVFITASTDGLGRAAAETLLENGHQVVMHARSAERAATPIPSRDLLQINKQSPRRAKLTLWPKWFSDVRTPA